MQPYTGTSDIISIPTRTAPASVPIRRARQTRLLSTVDALNLLIIAVGWAALLLILPAEHEYPIIDDWIYAGSVQHMLATGTFVMPDWSQANLVGLTLWGALWAKIFGFSFTVLTNSTLFLALLGLLAFYGIARSVNTPPWGALLGTALLAFNPIWIYLAFSFMTDVPFLAVVLISCYCYIRGLHHNRSGWAAWLIAGGLFTGWAFLMRQFALLVPTGFVGYLLLDGLFARRWRWRHLFLTMLVPALIYGLWYIWAKDFPQTWAAASAGGRAEGFLYKPLWIRVSLVRVLIFLPFVAFSAWAAIKIPRQRRWLIALWGVLVVLGMYMISLAPETAVAQVEPPFTARFGPFSLDFPQDSFTFGLLGSLFRLNGIDFEVFGYPQERVWTAEAWRSIWLLGVVLGILLLAKMSDALIDRLKTRVRHKALSPIAGFYIAGFLIFAASTAFPGDVFPRYVLGFVPFVILLVVRGSVHWGRLAWGYSVAALVILATFSVLAKLDHTEHMNVRWQAGLWMEKQVGSVGLGFDWEHWGGHMGSETYRIVDIPLEGFRTERRYPYTCRLCGFTTRYVLAQSRWDMLPLPPPSQAP